MQDETHRLRLTVAEFDAIVEDRLPFALQMGFKLELIEADGVTMRARYSEDFLRPGGTVSGPVMMGLADAAVYALILSRIGPVELAVTTSLNINFLRRPEPGDIVARARMLKLGKRLAVAEAHLYSDSGTEPVAHATATYSIPPVDTVTGA